MPKPTYSDFAYAGAFDVTNAIGVTEHVARFTVTRTLPDDNEPVAWVYVTYSVTDATGKLVEPRDRGAVPVIWGMWNSPSGTADVPLTTERPGWVLPTVVHDGTAWLTTDPSKQPRRGLSVTF